MFSADEVAAGEARRVLKREHQTVLKKLAADFATGVSLNHIVFIPVVKKDQIRDSDTCTTLLLLLHFFVFVVVVCMDWILAILV